MNTILAKMMVVMLLLHADDDDKHTTMKKICVNKGNFKREKPEKTDCTTADHNI